MRNVSNTLTPAIIAASCEAESKRAPAYLDAARYVVPFSARYADSDDVASVARILLPSLMLDGLSGTLAAGSAVQRAAALIAAESKPNSDPMRGAVSIEAERDTLGEIPADDVTRPDRIARWTDRDALGAVWDTLDDTARAIMSALRRPECWENGTPNARALVARLYGGREIPAGMTYGGLVALMADCIAQTVSDLRDAAGDLPAWTVLTPRNGQDAAKHARDTLRDTSVPTSGAASLVVRTTPNGARWVTLADRSLMLDDDGVALTLGNVDTLKAYDGGTAREADTATLAQHVSGAGSASPVAGVSAGMVWGSAGVAGTGQAYRKPVSRKRKRDGGIGSPMTRA